MRFFGPSRRSWARAPLGRISTSSSSRWAWDMLKVTLGQSQPSLSRPRSISKTQVRRRNDEGAVRHVGRAEFLAVRETALQVLGDMLEPIAVGVRTDGLGRWNARQQGDRPEHLIGDGQPTQFLSVAEEPLVVFPAVLPSAVLASFRPPASPTPEVQSIVALHDLEHDCMRRGSQQHGRARNDVAIREIGAERLRVHSPARRRLVQSGTKTGVGGEAQAPGQRFHTVRGLYGRRRLPKTGLQPLHACRIKSDVEFDQVACLGLSTQVADYAAAHEGTRSRSDGDGSSDF